MKLRVLLRKVHHWASAVVALPLLVMIVAGLFLMLKKDVDWIQPPTQRGVEASGPVLPLEDMFLAANTVPEAGFETWDDIDRVDVRPGKGVAKFRGENRWEVQVDTSTGEVLHTAYRRSDLIESIHDGSFFAGWTKHYLFLPAGIVLLGLWGTGLYLFFLPHVKNWQKRRQKQASTKQSAG